MEQPPKIGCVVMAAGNARRYGKNKLSQRLGGRPLICHALEAIPQELFAQVVVVTQYSEFTAYVKDFNFISILNLEAEKGISSTIALGLSALKDCDGVLFSVSDQPLLRRESVAALVELWRRTPDKIAALSHSGLRGNPCLFPARFCPELMALTGDRGGSAVIHRHEEDVVLLETAEQELWDVDTPEALEAIRASFET